MVFFDVPVQCGTQFFCGSSKIACSPTSSRQQEPRLSKSSALSALYVTFFGFTKNKPHFWFILYVSLAFILSTDTFWEEGNFSCRMVVNYSLYTSSSLSGPSIPPVPCTRIIILSIVYYTAHVSGSQEPIPADFGQEARYCHRANGDKKLLFTLIKQLRGTS